ncbi:NYN domain-containing protein [Candidatus Sumerlaeota bacterium]|nr:NYN domain-containing protein [Candidatus Sumerlaeota bacterium]
MPSAFFIDGFNLFYGMRQAQWKRLYWLDLYSLCYVLNGYSAATHIEYFTAMIKPGSDKQKSARQISYIDALSSTPSVKITRGQYLSKTKTCRMCSATWNIEEEKQTDVNIAVSILENAALGKYDKGYIISGDSDLEPAISSVKRLYPAIEMHVVFPPCRVSKLLRISANSDRILDHEILSRCQFPDTVTTSSGFVVSRPSDWKR